MSVLSKIPTVAKAITGGVTAFGAAFAVAYQDGAVTTGEWISIVVATLVATVAVWAVPNRAPEPEAQPVVEG